MKKINPLAAQAKTKTIPAICNAKEEHFYDCHSKKKHILCILKTQHSWIIIQNVAKKFIFMPIPVWNLSVKA